MTKPIALFDSGVGGLTVLKSIVGLLPYENYVYLADSDFFPYGTKQFDQLDARIQQVTQRLISFDLKGIVVACNTASLHLSSIKKLADVPVIDAIFPTVQKAIATTKNKQVCLLATDATVSSGRYQKLLSASGVEVIAIPCSDFVPLAENGQLSTATTLQLVQRKLQPFLHLHFDTVILGCTHFGLLEQAIRSVLGQCNYVQCGDAIGQVLVDTLSNANLQQGSKKGRIDVFSTGKTDALFAACQLQNLQISSLKTINL